MIERRLGSGELVIDGVQYGRDEIAELDYGSQHYVVNLGYCNQTELEQVQELLRALGLFREKNQRYKDLWKEGGPEDSAHHVRSKAARTYTSSKTDTVAQQIQHLDDPLDLINYAAFYVRNVREARAQQTGCKTPGCTHVNCAVAAVMMHESDDTG